MNTRCNCELCWMDIAACDEFKADANVPTACTVCWHDEPCHDPLAKMQRITESAYSDTVNPLVRPDNG